MSWLFCYLRRVGGGEAEAHLLQTARRRYYCSWARLLCVTGWLGALLCDWVSALVQVPTPTRRVRLP